ncbi:MAG: ABC transporter permease [Acidobacteriota bacterium]
MSASLDVLWLLAKRTWLKTWRRPVVLSFSLVQPLIWMTFFGFLFVRFRPEVPREGLSYLDFLAPGVSVMTILFGASQVGVGWIRDLQTGFLPRMLNTPASPHALLLGKILADVARLLLQALLVLLLALALGARLDPAWSAMPMALLCVALFALAFACVSSTVALVARTQEVMGTFIHLINMPLLFTSTALVPERQMPDWLAAIASWNPLSPTVDAWRGALLFEQAPSPMGQVVPLALFTLGSYGVALQALRRISRAY